METQRYYLITPLAYTGRATAFTYHHTIDLVAGQIVEIPIGRRIVTGIVTAQLSEPTFKTKAIIRMLDLPPLPQDLSALATWMATYYASSPSSVWSTILPAGIMKARRIQPAIVAANPAQGMPAYSLNPEQIDALIKIRASAHSTHLIQGVTGSGKTRLYLELANEAINQGKSAIILVPEITLTQQVVAQFEDAFGQLVLTTHSKLTEAKRHAIWTAANSAALAMKPRIIIGPRSCLFIPVYQLGLIVIDESHETTYKQEHHPRYHSVTTAAFRARVTGARLILGSATPGLSELYLANIGKIEHILLTQRANSIPHSEAKIIDLRDKDLFKLSKFITQPLFDAITDTLLAGRQTLLYLNRRGSASSQICSDCGQVSLCPNCALPLTFHADLMRLICHHCNFRRASQAVCPQCHGINLKLLGGGTKRIEAEVMRLWPDARIARLDRDSATLPYIHTVLKQLRSGNLDIIIGTQMIAKGLDLPAIDTVGIVSADTMLHLPDFTAAERTFQLLSQVSGRAGRGDRAGQVFIQTYTPNHPAIVAAATGAYERFANAELTERRLMHYPPYVHLLKLTIALSTQEATQIEANRLTQELKKIPGLAIIGPAPAFLELGSSKYHWIITCKSKHRQPLVDIAAALPSDSWTADLDPVNLL